MRNILRSILILEGKKRLRDVSDKKNILYDKNGIFREFSSEEKIQVLKLNFDWREINLSLGASICIYECCNAANKDMGYIPILKR